MTSLMPFEMYERILEISFVFSGGIVPQMTAVSGGVSIFEGSVPLWSLSIRQMSHPLSLKARRATRKIVSFFVGLMLTLPEMSEAAKPSKNLESVSSF